MKFSLLAATLVCLSGLRASTYYVSPSGSDTMNDGLSQQLPFQTIQKAADVMGTGDTCRILAGVYRESVIVRDSGVTFRAEEAGTVTIDGSDPVTGWVLESPNVYAAPMAWTLGDGNQIFQADVMKPEARWPNAGSLFPWQNSRLAHPTNTELGDWSYVDSGSYNAGAKKSLLTDVQLPARADGYWKDATLHIVSGLGWIMRHLSVTASANKTLTADDPDGGDPAFAVTPGNEYYLTGLRGELDAEGEWFHDPATQRLLFFSSAPPAGVAAKKRPYGFDLRGRSQVNLINLSFFACTIQTDGGTTQATFDGLSMRYLGHNKKTATSFGLKLWNNCTLRNSDLGWDSHGLVYLAGNDIRVINNRLHDSGYAPFWDSIVHGYGSRNLISHNTLSSAGRAVMGSPGREAIVQFNDMSNAMRLTTDGGILYTYQDAGNTVFRYNLLHDSPGSVGRSGAGVQGFYQDCLNSNWIVHHNIIWGLPGYAMQFNARQNFNMVFNNTCWNTSAGSLITAASQDGESGSRFYNNLFNNAPKGEFATWGLTDFQNNLYADPGFVDPGSGNFQLRVGSPGIDKGREIPGVTDAGTAPDIGALESGLSDWTTGAGCQTIPPSPDPAYSMPDMAFANRIKNGSFETANFSGGWSTTSGSNAGINNRSASWVPGFQGQSRSGYYAVKFGEGTSELRQTATGLMASRRYKVYAGIQTADPDARIVVGVRNQGAAPLELEIPGGTGGVWEMVNLAFVTGAAATSAEIYIQVISASSTVPVYVDDISVELATENTDPQPYNMPFLSYPFNETSGSLAYDASTNSRNASLTNTTFVGGPRGNALRFLGAGSSASASSVPATTGSFTVAFWVKFDETGLGTPVLASNNNASWQKKGWYLLANENRSIGIYLWSRDNSAATDNPPTALTAWTAQTATAGTWTHVAFTVDRQSGVLCGYRDGILSAAVGIPSEFGNFDTLTGLRLGGTDLKGQMDSFQIWDSALSEGILRTLANPDPSLALRLKLDENPGATKAWDASGNGKNGTLVGMNASTAWENDSLRFSGTGYVQCPKLSATASPGGSFTVSFWVKFDAADTGTPLLASNTNGSNVVKGWYIQASANRSIGMGLHDGTTSFSMWHAQMTAPAGVWTHITYTVDRENGVLSGYCNGTFKTSTPIPTGFGDVDTNNGPRLGSGPKFSGKLDEVQIFSKVLDCWELSPPSPTPNGLQTFRTTHDLPANGSHDTATPADDGVPNLLKYAFNMLGTGPAQAESLATPNTAPLSPSGSAGLPFVAFDSGFLHITYIRRKAASDPGITYSVQFSNTLSDPWAINASATETTSPLDTTFERVTVTDSVPNPSQRFVRVRITIP